MKFINETKPAIIDHLNKNRPGNYIFDKAPKLLFEWSRLFQSVISQAGTYLLTGKFHDQHCSIYKCEGGCRIAGKGDLVLKRDHCYWDYEKGTKAEENNLNKIANLISEIVIAWNPNNPIDSMINKASEVIKVNPNDLRTSITNSTNAGVFGGNALSSFFDWNPFSDPLIDRKYDSWCLMTFEKWTKEEVKQKYTDQDLGKSLLDKMNKMIRKNNPDILKLAHSCRPERKDGKLMFYVGSFNQQLNGWKTQEEIEQFIALASNNVVEAEKE